MWWNFCILVIWETIFKGEVPMREFERFHPIVNLVYFALVMGMTMFWMHPIFLACSLLASFTYLWVIEGKNAGIFLIKLLPLALIAILINALFHHRGSTILGYFQNGNPLTLESIVFGASASMMILATILWFRLFHRLMTSDKLLFLFGKTVPKLSLLLSMILRFIPRMISEFQEIHHGQQALGIREEGLWKRVKSLGNALLTEVSLAFENSIEISMSMKMRGYQEQKRSYFSIFRFHQKDFWLLIIIFVLFVCIVMAVLQGVLYYRYYPTIQMNSCGIVEKLIIMCYGLLLYLPLVIEIRESVRWKRLRSKI